MKEPLTFRRKGSGKKEHRQESLKDFLSRVVKEKVKVHFPRRNQGKETHQKQHGRIKAVWLNGEAGPDHMGAYRPC